LSHDGTLASDGTCGTRPSDNIGRALNRSKLYQLVSKLTFDTQDREFELYLAIINQIKKLSLARNQSLVIGFVKAERAWFSGTYSNERIMEQFSEMGIDVIDLTLALSAEELAREYYIHPLDKHPSAKANEARAMLVHRYLNSVPSGHSGSSP